MFTPSKQELFDEWFQRIGLGQREKYDPNGMGRYMTESSYNQKMSQLRKPVNQIIEAVLKSDEVSGQPPIYFDFLKSKKLGAYATISPTGDEFIAINIGTYHLLFDLFYRLLSHPDIFSWIGDPGKERRDLPPIRTLYLDHEMLFHYGHLNYGRYQLAKPIDQIRLDYAYHLFSFAMEFLTYHEINHFVRGHVRYLKSLNGTHTISEINSTNNGLDITIPTLEWDADQIATIIMLVGTIKVINNPSLVGKYISPFYQDAEEAIFNLLTAIYFLFRVMGPGSYDIIKLKSLTHAPPRVRQHMILHTMEYTLSLQPNLQSINFERIIKRVVIESERAVKIVTAFGFEVDSVFDAYTPESYAYINDIASNWRVIYPDLQKFSRMELRDYFFVQNTSIPKWVM